MASMPTTTKNMHNKSHESIGSISVISINVISHLKNPNRVGFLESQLHNKSHESIGSISVISINGISHLKTQNRLDFLESQLAS